MKCALVILNDFLVKLFTLNKPKRLVIHLANYCSHQIATPIPFAIFPIFVIFCEIFQR